MRILQFGATGQVARAVAAEAAARGLALTALSRVDADLNDPAACAALIARTEADIVLNAAGFTHVDAAEAEPWTAHRVNAEAPGAMAAACAARGLPFVHLSTDYVFDGEKTAPYDEGDPCRPLGAYGASKRAGELAVLAAGVRGVVLRVSWVFSAFGPNFALALAARVGVADEIAMVADQTSKPTYAPDLAAFILDAAPRWIDDPPGASTFGLFQFANPPEVNRFDYARAILEAAAPDARGRPRLVPTASKDYPSPARRPAYSAMDAAKLEETFAVALPSWREGLAAIFDARTN